MLLMVVVELLGCLVKCSNRPRAKCWSRPLLCVCSGGRAGEGAEEVAHYTTVSLLACVGRVVGCGSNQGGEGRAQGGRTQGRWSSWGMNSSKLLA